MIPSKLLLRERLAYGCGDFASCLFWASFSSFLFIFYTDVFGLSALAVGTMLGISRALDAFFDPAIGMIADRTQTRWGKFRPYLLWIPIPFAIGGTLLFTTPDLGPTGKLVWAFVTYNLMMLLYTAVNIPYTALLGVITPDSVERTRVSSMKFIFANGAYVVVQAVLMLMVKFLGGDNPQRGWQLSFAVIGAVATVFFFLTFAGTRERVTPPPHQKTSVKADLRDLSHNAPWFILVAITVTFVLFTATYSTVSAHYIKYFVGARTLQLPWDAAPRLYEYEKSVSIFLTLGSIGAVAGVFMIGAIVGRFGKKAAFVGCFSIAIATSLAFYGLKPEQFFLMLVLHFVRCLAGGPLAVILWAMYADTADYSEWKTSRRATGLVFSASIMTQKFSWAGAGVAVGWMLSTTGFVANALQGERVLQGLVSLMSIIPAVFGVVSVLIMMVYPLNETRLAEIQSDLQQRRLVPAETTAPLA